LDSTFVENDKIFEEVIESFEDIKNEKIKNEEFENSEN